jgi:RNA-binding protein
MAEEDAPAPAELSGFQRTWLRGRAHALEPVVQVGHAGLTDGVIAAVAAALLDHELIKVRLYRPANKKGMAAELAGRCGAHLCGLVGHTVILYKPHPEEPVLVLPRRAGKAAGGAESATARGRPSPRTKRTR